MRVTFGIGIGKLGRSFSPEGFSTQEAIESALVYLSKRFGGCTLVKCEGAWVDGRDNLVREESIQLQCETKPIHPDVIQGIAQLLRIVFRQDSVIVSLSESEVIFAEEPSHVKTSSP